MGAPPARPARTRRPSASPRRALRGALLVLALTAPVAAQARTADSVALGRDLERWTAELDTERPLSSRRAEWIAGAVDRLGELVGWPPDLAVLCRLLDVAGARLERAPEPSHFLGGDALHQVRAMGLRELREVLGRHPDELSDLLLRGVVAEPRAHPKERRFAALHLVRERRSRVMDLVLVGLARSADDPLRPAALELLAERAGPEIDAVLIEYLDAPRDLERDPNPFALAMRRLQRGPLAPAAELMLLRRNKAALLSADWRETSRAIALSRAVDPQRSAPMLIEALWVWRSRLGTRGGSLRIVHDLASELERVSGRSIGTNPQRWSLWWEAVSDGATPLRAPDSEEPRSRPTFFGLSPASDRVTFVLDHSGSMAEPWGTTGRSRYEEAIEQLLRFLEAGGPTTRFNVILFDSAPLESSPNLVPAEPEILERVRASLARRPPGGGTALRAAVELALHLGPDGRPDTAALQADTVVVLCDGETNSGPEWVEPVLGRVLAETRVVFHCVRIGSLGDGTLEELSRLTDGQFLRVDG